MAINSLKENMQLVIEGPFGDQSILPWDLRTLFDCMLTLEDATALECGVHVQIGDTVLSLRELR